MIEYLEKLVEEKQYEAALRYAEQMLLGADLNAQEIIRIYDSVAFSRLRLKEYYGAVVAGKVCKEAAREAGEWDLFGKACIDLSSAYAELGQIQMAIAQCYDYLECLNRYTSSYELQSSVWFNLGVLHRDAGDITEAAKMFSRGLQVATQEKRLRIAHGLRHALAQVLCRQGRIEEATRLLAQSLAYIHSLPAGVDRTRTLLWHILIRAESAVRLERFHRAVRLVQRGLALASGFPYLQSSLMLVLATAAVRQGHSTLAIRHLLSARVFAVQGRCYDLELRASEWMYQLSKDDPDSLERLDSSDLVGFEMDEVQKFA